MIKESQEAAAIYKNIMGKAEVNLNLKKASYFLLIFLSDKEFPLLILYKLYTRLQSKNCIF